MNRTNQGRPNKSHHNNPKNYVRKTFLELGQDLKNEHFGSTSILSDFANGENADQLIEKIEKFVRKKGENLSSTQLRNIYDKIINADDIMSLKMIRPQLAYLAGRTSGRGAQDSKSFLSFIDLLIKETTKETLGDFKKFMEMIVAYHKYYGKN